MLEKRRGVPFPETTSLPATIAEPHPARQLLAAGIDVCAFDPPPLTTSLWLAIEDRVLAVRGGEDRWELACALPQRCGERLAAGESARQVLEWLRHPAVARLLRERRDVRMAVLDTSLPLPLLERLGEIRKRLGRWWPGRLRRAEREQVLVRQCETWTEALKSGTPVAALLQEPLRTQVRTARNEQLQRRSWVSRLVRWCRQGAAWALLGSVVLYGVLWVRLALLQPSDQGRDLLAAYDDASLAIPEEQRAWPLVKRFWDGNGGLSNLRWQLGLNSAWVAGPSDPNWREARAELATIRADSWDLLLRASRRPALGYVFRDWPDQPGQLSNMQLVISGSRWQSRQLSSALHLLQGEAHRALENSDPDRAVEMTLATLGLARLAVDGRNHPFVIQLGENGILELTQLIGTICHSGQLSAEALIRLRDALGPPAPSTPPTGIDVERLLIEQLDRLYSPGEDGAVTRRGLEVLWTESNIPGGGPPVITWLMWPLDRPWAQRFLSFPGRPVLPLAPVLAPVMVRRRGAADEIARMVAAARGRVDPAADPVGFLEELRIELDGLRQGELSQCRYMPVIVTLESSLPVLADLLVVPGDPRPRQAAEAALVVRVGLELHRRRIGAFPESLEELAPREFAALPLDPYGGQPLKLRHLNDRVWLYSVGDDKWDDTVGWSVSDPRRPIHPWDRRLLEVTAKTQPVPEDASRTWPDTPPPPESGTP
jgi:hypothetical protein